MAEKTFEQINQHLILRLGKDRTFVGKEFSYFKLFQHGVVYDFNKSKNKTLRTFFHWPLWIQKLIWTRKVDTLKLPQYFLKKNIWLEPGRVYEDAAGQRHSMYGSKLMSALEDEYTSINLSPGKGIQSSYNIDDFPQGFSRLDGMESRLLKDVIFVSQRLKKSAHYTSSEKEYILSAMHVFFSAFRKYYCILKDRGVEKFYFIAHYHNEGLIAACSLLGIECIELQHGLINKNDLYYVYHSIFTDALEKGLMPNKIMLYGSYWKEVLSRGCEWKHDQPKVAGNYLAHSYSPPDLSKKENLILIAAQKGMDDKYLPYIETLRRNLKHHPEWKMVVKLHPLEKKAEKYMTLKNSQCEIAPLHSSIFQYLEKSKIQISIYSTTFFDSAGYQVYNLSWLTSGIGSDYAANLIHEGLVDSLHPEEDPIVKYNDAMAKGYKFLEVSRFYGDFSSQIFK